MVFAVVVLALSVVLGLALRGSLDSLSDLHLRYGVLVLLAVLVQLGGALLGGPAYPVGLGLSAVLVAGFLARNRGVRGTGLVALGLFANALVVGLNGAMPVSAWASAEAGIGTQDLLAGSDPRHQLADHATALRPLGDVIPVLLPWRPEVVSPGDVLVAAGLAQLVVIGMTRARRGAVSARRCGRWTGVARW